MIVEVEVIDAPLEYHLRSQLDLCNDDCGLYSFPRDLFPCHQGKIITIDQLSYFKLDPTTSSGPGVPLIDDSMRTCKTVGGCTLWELLISLHPYPTLTLPMYV
jgi:hypothetical protein